jgi:hypothetical protein
MTDQTIDLSAGAIEYTNPRLITEVTGKDITSDQVFVSLAGWEAPGSWVTPDVVTRPTASSVSVALLIGAAFKPAAGDYWLWTRVTDSPEVVPRRSPGRIHIT